MSVVSSPENRERESLKPYSRLLSSLAIADGSLDVVASLLDETGLERPSEVAAVGSDEPCPADPFIDCRLANNCPTRRFGAPETGSSASVQILDLPPHTRVPCPHPGADGALRGVTSGGRVAIATSVMDAASGRGQSTGGNVAPMSR